MSRITNLVTLSSILVGCVPAAPQTRVDHAVAEPPPPVDERVTANEAPPPPKPKPAPKPAVSVPRPVPVQARPMPALHDLHDRCARTRAYPSWCREEKIRMTRKIESDGIQKIKAGDAP
jgi:hypothetical protein